MLPRKQERCRFFDHLLFLLFLLLLLLLILLLLIRVELSVERHRYIRPITFRLPIATHSITRSTACVSHQLLICILLLPPSLFDICPWEFEWEIVANLRIAIEEREFLCMRQNDATPSRRIQLLLSGREGGIHLCSLEEAFPTRRERVERMRPLYE